MENVLSIQNTTPLRYDLTLPNTYISQYAYEIDTKTRIFFHFRWFLAYLCESYMVLPLIVKPEIIVGELLTHREGFI